MANPNYVAGAFRFQLEYDQIMKLLMDKSLYPDPSLFLRELLQNSLDACRYQEALATDHGMADKYVPRIQVEDLSSLPHDPENPENGPRIIFRDNGIGMSQEQVENYFLRAGKSFYRSANFKAERQRLADKGIHLDACSRFGIGFLSCFLVGDQIEVVTYRNGSQPLRIKIEGQSRYFVIERLTSADAPIPFLSPEDPEQDRPPSYAGTSVTVWLRKEASEIIQEQDSLPVYQTLNAVAVNQPYDLLIINATGETTTVNARRWEVLPPAAVYKSNTFFSEADVADRLLAEKLVPVSVRLNEVHTNLQGSIDISFLSDGGTPVTQLGYLQHLDDGDIGLTEAAALVFTFTSGLQGCSQEVADDLARLMSNAENSLISEHSLLKVTRKDDWQNTGHLMLKLSRYLSSRKADRELFVEASKLLPCMKSPRYSFCTDTMLEALLSGSSSKLLGAISSEGHLETNWNWHRSEPKLSLALYGIIVPGEIQYWNHEQARAKQYSWLPNSVRVRCDVHGPLAPEPAASRLFVPYERSRELRDIITRAVIDHAFAIVKKQGSTDEWQQWLASFLWQWESYDLASALSLAYAKELNDYLRTSAYDGSSQRAKLSPRDLCIRYGNEVLVLSGGVPEKSGEAVADAWWLPGYLERFWDEDASSAIVDLQPLRDALGIN